MIHNKKFDFTDFKKSPRSEKPSKNSCHKSNTSNTNIPYQFINMDFYITSKSVRGSTISTITRIYAGRSGVQILVEEKEQSFPKNIQPSSITHRASNSMKTTAISVAIKWPGQPV